MIINATFDNAIIKPIQMESKTLAGIILPQKDKEQQRIAQVIGVGSGLMQDGRQVDMQVKPGDIVIYPSFAGEQVKIDGEKHIIMSQQHILAVLEK